MTFEKLPYPLTSPWVWGTVGRFGLPFWFFLTSVAQWLALAGPWRPGFDTELAVGASRTWLAGGSPWAYFLIGGDGNVYHFAGLPPTLFVYAPLTPLGLEFAGYLGVALSAVAAVVVLRRLKLPLWWLLFPPLNAAVYFANPHMLLMLLLLSGASWLAPAVKVYALIPMLGEARWREIALGLAIFAATVLAAPTLWTSWLSDLWVTNARLVTEAQGGWSLTGPLVILGVLPIAVIALRKGPRTAGWLVVPAVWPASEFFYSTTALPVITPLLAVFLAVPLHLGPPLGIAVYALQVAWRCRASRWPRPREFLRNWLAPTPRQASP
jgi:hypothetical protein